MKFKLKIVDCLTNFPGDDVLKPVDPGIPFPISRRTRYVPCSFQDLSGTVFKPHMKDGGSCEIPNGYTLTLAQWQRQQESQC